MKIVMIITGLGVGGAELSLLNFVEKLRHEDEVYVVSLLDKGDVGEKIEALGVSVLALEINSIKSCLLGFLKLVRFLKEIMPDVVHTWMYHADCLGGLAAKAAGVPAIIWSLHCCNLEPGMVKSSTRALVKVCALISWFIPSKVISCSQASVNIHEKVGYASNKMVVIPNGINMNKFVLDDNARGLIRRELALTQDTILVGLIARYDVQKNHLGFIKAAQIIHEKHPTVHFVLAGKDIDIKNHGINKAINSAGIESVTHLLGLRDDVPKIMASLDVLVSSSSGEAFPLVLGEAMACGVPCAVTDVGDSALIVGDAGHVVNAGDMDALASAIERIIELPKEERVLLGQRAYNRIKDNFDFSEILERYRKKYIEFIPRKKINAR